MTNHGKAFEDALQYQHNIYRGEGLAEIWHERTAGKFVSGGKFVPDPQKSRPDFMGILSPHGRAIAFDAKSVSGEKKQWKLKKERIHQFHDLREISRFGAITFFMIEDRARQILYLRRIRFDDPTWGIPFIIFELPYAEAELLRFPIRKGYLPEYLSAVLGSQTFISSLSGAPTSP